MKILTFAYQVIFQGKINTARERSKKSKAGVPLIGSNGTRFELPHELSWFLLQELDKRQSVFLCSSESFLDYP